MATVDFSETSPVCGSRAAAAAAAARLNSHSRQMSAVVLEGARENSSFGFEFPWKGKRGLLFSGWFGIFWFWGFLFAFVFWGFLFFVVVVLLLLFCCCCCLSQICCCFI